jgi:Leucine-rich repeat (LRR) protein
MKLSSMEGLQHLPNLRQINLESNLITKIECIDSCKLLEELNLENNLIAKI